ncbi:HNH endonuclease [Paenibacillus sp. JX-17]|uniref:HNH endonuclease n=1 Tax=Paenibacillus lacisoli TaxID=3064525 RepID=A0ABT9CL95_9BACL|nr:HNH endonuclease [Paenibacillus sp. JX-17]MDO7908697.1 HNH endonuclease [Paenibacillus sp. JX-17]
MHPIDCSGKVFIKEELIHANNAAIKEERNRQLKEDFLEKLSPEIYYPICLAFDHHNKGEVRVEIVFGEGLYGFLDMSKKRYDLLPVASKNEEGRVILTYPNGKAHPDNRPYEEKVHKKLVRKRDFRKQVLEAYNYKCAMCEVKAKSSLKAAHIYPAHKCNDDSIKNGICLCAIHDAEYEVGNICIKPDGTIINFVIDEIVIANYNKISLPDNPENHPSSERLQQRFELSLTKRKKKN